MLVIIIVINFFVHCSTFYSLCYSILFSFDSFAFIIHCALFKREKFNSDPGLYSRYFDPADKNHLCEPINIIQQTAPTLSSYRSEGPITTIDIAG
jgi:hypothetical protein